MSNRSVNERIDGAQRDAARFETTGELVLVLGDDESRDADHRLILYLSPAWEHFFDRPLASLLGCGFPEVLDDSPLQIVLSNLIDEHPNSRTVPVLEEASILLQYTDSMAGLRTLEGHAYRALENTADWLIIFRDATARWSALAKLAGKPQSEPAPKVVSSQRLESLGALAGGVAHAFNNVLTPIVGNISLALLDLPANSPVRKRIEMIRTAADRATALTRQMLAYANQDDSKVNAIDLTIAVEEMTLLLEVISSGSTRIDYTLKPGLPFIEVDSQHIGQVLLNLVANACESFTTGGGQIDISTGSLDADRAYLDRCRIGNDLEKGSYVYLEVCDDGSGISEKDRASIFDPYFSTRSSGHGLGLTAIEEIVRHYRGALELMSAVGEGTRVRVLFPTIY